MLTNSKYESKPKRMFFCSFSFCFLLVVPRKAQWTTKFDFETLPNIRSNSIGSDWLTNRWSTLLNMKKKTWAVIYTTYTLGRFAFFLSAHAHHMKSSYNYSNATFWYYWKIAQNPRQLIRRIKFRLFKTHVSKTFQRIRSTGVW